MEHSRNFSLLYGASQSLAIEAKGANARRDMPLLWRGLAVAVVRADGETADLGMQSAGRALFGVEMASRPA
jgi:hypothetical protein